jgi:mono/diheme cytochrome c family protein
MRKFLIISGYLATTLLVIGCRGKNDPGSAYMPDMWYSRAYETYAGLDTTKFTTDRNAWGRNEQSKIFYNSMPVAGTIARGDIARYTIPNDSSGYTLSASVKNPVDTSSVNKKEISRLYLIHCGICHGAKLDGNGPLFNGGNGPYPAAPRNLLDDYSKALSEGTMFHVMTYGKGMMGSYASQLTSSERWALAAYIKQMQAGGGGAAAKGKVDSVGTAAKDTTAAGTGTR